MCRARRSSPPSATPIISRAWLHHARRHARDLQGSEPRQQGGRRSDSPRPPFAPARARAGRGGTRRGRRRRGRRAGAAGKGNDASFPPICAFALNRQRPCEPPPPRPRERLSIRGPSSNSSIPSARRHGSRPRSTATATRCSGSPISASAVPNSAAFRSPKSPPCGSLRPRHRARRIFRPAGAALRSGPRAARRLGSVACAEKALLRRKLDRLLPDPSLAVQAGRRRRRQLTRRRVSPSIEGRPPRAIPARNRRPAPL